MGKRVALYAQSGGVTAVINASACGLITACRQNNVELYAAKDGILGVINNELFDTQRENNLDIANLRYTPGGAFGSCRYKISTHDEYDRIITTCKAHNIQYFFYNGGNDSADTCLKIAKRAQDIHYPLQAIHIPKTIDNDLVVTDNCPGYGSVAKYVATSIREAGMDLRSMSSSSTKVFILEVMGRHAGWITAACGLASTQLDMPPHILLFPEVAFDQGLFLEKVACCVKQYGYCVIAVSEGLRDQNNQLIGASQEKDSFGHLKLGGVGLMVANIIHMHLKLKFHVAIVDYLQRSARHLASKTDVEQAYQLGETALELAIAGHTSIMLTIDRIQQSPYKWNIGFTDLENVANLEKTMPSNFITSDGFHITPSCRQYIEPLICGEDYPDYVNGLPNYVTLQNHRV